MPEAAKSTWGGKRTGAGRPTTPTVRMMVTVRRETAVALEREARKMGLKKCKGALPYLGTVIDRITGPLKEAIEEPEYIRLARELNLCR